MLTGTQGNICVPVYFLGFNCGKSIIEFSIVQAAIFTAKSAKNAKI